MKIGLFFRLTVAIGIGSTSGIGGTGFAAGATPNLPPAEVVTRVLQTNLSVQAAAGQVRVEEANRSRLEAGQYEWNVRIGGQQRRSKPATGTDERFNEWSAAVERPLRLPGKGRLDGELGAAGVALAETAHGDALHEASRNLLKSWFVWLKESASAAQWAEQLALLDKQAKAIQRRQQLGDAARLESIQAAAALAQAEAALAQARVRQQTAGEDLRRRYPGLPLVTDNTIAEPTPIEGNETDWINAILEHSHELNCPRGKPRRPKTFPGRPGKARGPTPPIGLIVPRDRAGGAKILGPNITTPRPGGARRASSDAALAHADVAGRREAFTTQKITAESAMLYQSANAAFSTWQASRSAAERLGQAADMTARAYQLGEGSLNDLLAARRLANEAQLAARLIQLEALEQRYRLLLDAHRLWVMEEEKHASD